jgi:hypothetical protein
MTITRTGLRRLAGLLVLALSISIFVMRSGFFTPDFLVSNDTPSYVNVPGLGAGLSISNFGSRFRPPGFGLFLAASTFGGLPRDKAMVHVDCGDSVLSQDPACDKIIPKDRNDIVLRTGQAIFIVPPRRRGSFGKSPSRRGDYEPDSVAVLPIVSTSRAIRRIDATVADQHCG